MVHLWAGKFFQIQLQLDARVEKKVPAWQGWVPVFIKYVSVIYAVFLLIMLSA